MHRSETSPEEYAMRHPAIRTRRCVIALIAMIAAGAALAACNTFRGFGKDMENAGEAIQRAGEND